MKLKIRNCILGSYDLILATIAIFTGILMIRSDYGIFLEYPAEWIGKIPFHSWTAPGVILIILFGLGNITATFLCFMNESGRNWFISGIMGLFILLSTMIQVIVLGDWYMATLQTIILGSIQVVLSFYVYLGLRKKSKIMLV